MKAQRNPTIRDVAKLANVSVATVSRVLNDSGPVSKKSREKILRVIEENGYYPNSIARNLKMDHTKTIAVLLSDGMDEYFVQITNGIDSVVRADDYMIFFCNSRNNQHIEEDNLRLVTEKKVDGLIIHTSGYNDEQIAKISKMIPTVLIHRRVEAPGFIGDFLDADHGVVCHDLALEMIRNGHSRIAFINGPLKLSSMKDRFVNFNRAMNSIGVEVTPQYPYYYEGPITQEFGQQAIHAILHQDHPATAVIIAHGETTLGVIRYLRANQIPVPDRISFATTAKITLADLLYVRPTYAMPDTFTMGVRAANLIMSRIRDHELPNREVSYMPVIIQGDSIKRIVLEK